MLTFVKSVYLVTIVSANKYESAMVKIKDRFDKTGSKLIIDSNDEHWRTQLALRMKVSTRLRYYKS